MRQMLSILQFSFCSSHGMHMGNPAFWCLHLQHCELVQPVNFNDMLSSVYLPRPVSLSAKTCQGSYYSMQLIQHVPCAVQTGTVKCATKFRTSLNGGAQSDACIALPGWPLGHPGLHAHMTYRVQSQLRQLNSAFCSGHGGVRGLVLLFCL